MSGRFFVWERGHLARISESFCAFNSRRTANLNNAGKMPALPAISTQLAEIFI